MLNRFDKLVSVVSLNMVKYNRGAGADSILGGD